MLRRIKLKCHFCKNTYSAFPSEKLTSKCCSMECRNKYDSIRYSGTGNPFYGKKHKKDYKFKGEYKPCEICNKTIRLRPSRKKNNRGRFCSKECYSIAKSKEVLGINNSNWLGGISKEPYPFIFNEELKEKIRKRDNYECQLCHILEEEHIIVWGRVLIVHHIDYCKDNCADNNLTSVCLQCNARVNFNRNYWKEYFQNERTKVIPEI